MRKGANVPDAKLSFARDIHYISQKWSVGLGNRMKPIGLEGQLWFVLYSLNEVPKPATQRAVADMAGISPPTLVRLLDTLEQRGLIRRGPVEGDRRANAIRITPRAEALLQEISQISETWREELLQDVDPFDLDICVRVLDSVRSKIANCAAKRVPQQPAYAELA
ncbi:MAG TPA: MarR family transcriptional regulator [Alphaproteobacteria bacterium]|nr:MarR family transcriptional regulator [Alphaproteobacteria bacterium]